MKSFECARLCRNRCAILSILMMLATAATSTNVFGASAGFSEPCTRTESFSLPATLPPWDFRTATPGALRMVELNHFTPNIASLLRGNTGTLAQELSFVLHSFPNHHRALATVARYGIREKSPQPGHLDYTVDCYFQRAMRFQPDDNITRLLYADYLGKTQRVDQAVPILEQVRSVAKDNPITLYNIGLLYFEFGRYPEALVLAHASMALGIPRTELRDQLKSKGQWSDPPASPTEGAASTPSRSN